MRYFVLLQAETAIAKPGVIDNISYDKEDMVGTNKHIAVKAQLLNTSQIYRQGKILISMFIRYHYLHLFVFMLTSINCK